MISGTVFLSPPSWSGSNTAVEAAVVASFESPLLISATDAPIDLAIWGPGSTQQQASAGVPGFIPAGLLIAKESFGLYAGYGGSPSGPWIGQAPPAANFTPPWVPGQTATAPEGWYVVPGTDVFRLRLEAGESLYGGLVCWAYLPEQQSSPLYWGVSGGSGIVSFVGSPC